LVVVAAMLAGEKLFNLVRLPVAREIARLEFKLPRGKVLDGIYPTG
jgi:hypothetical protein